jgi:glucosamine-6-phosphate deaminase
MHIHIHDTGEQTGAAAAEKAGMLIQQAINQYGEAHIILATGASQFSMLSRLVTLNIDWGKVTAFHLDEYIGIPVSHPASFRKYLQERFLDQISGLKAFHFVNGEHPHPQEECQRLGAILSGLRIDLACVGIGENGHLAFNDPPADFETEDAFLVVTLDEGCRMQQLGEGWFPDLEAVPQHAISMSIRQIMKSEAVICTVPDARKAQAVQKTIEGPVTNLVPASILQQHPQCYLYLDNASTSLLQPA